MQPMIDKAPVILKMWFQTSGIITIWEFLKMQTLRIYLRPSESETQWLGPAICA